jgi:putative MATE family efflux protein
MKAPKEAFDLTTNYIKICGAGFIVISAYNLLGSIFRGLGDSKTPLIAVGMACVFNIIGDLVLVSVFNMGAAGAALATVLAQLLSVVISFFMIRRATLPFEFRKAHVKLKKSFVTLVAKIGIPVASQEFLVGISFLVLLAIVNQLGVTASAGVGVAQKVCTFIMLVPISFMQSMTAFVAQNYGAGQMQRAQKTLKIGVGISFAFGIVMFLVSFFRGDLLASVFSQDADTIQASWDYLKAYAIDCLFTCFLFCFIGYFNGIGKTKFVMLQGLCGAFIIRVPFALLMQQIGNGSLFLIGMSIPCSTVLQIAMFFIAYFKIKSSNIQAE